MSQEHAEIVIYCPGGPIAGWTTLAAAEALLTAWRANNEPDHTIDIHPQSFSGSVLSTTVRLATISAIAMRSV